MIGPVAEVTGSPLRSTPLPLLSISKLLEIGGKARQALIVRNNGLGSAIEDIAVPNGKKAHQHRNVVGDFRLAKMAIYIVAPLEEIQIVSAADGDRERQPDARPDRVAAAHPVPETKHARRVDAEFGDFVEARRDRCEMVAHSVGAESVGDP